MTAMNTNGAMKKESNSFSFSLFFWEVKQNKTKMRGWKVNTKAAAKINSEDKRNKGM